ncbi:hypothetical protein Tco_0067126 [Tanacetum coccineum]
MIPLYYDNKSAIALCCNNVQHSRAKHIDVRYHFIKEQVENGMVELYLCRRNINTADIVHQTHAAENSTDLIEKLGMRSMSSKTLKRLKEEENETMNPSVAEQIALNNALVAHEVRLTIGKCNRRIPFTKPQREATYQVTLDALKLSPCYLAFLITAGVPEIYMHRFWNTVSKVKDSSSYQFKLDNKKFRVNAEVFRDILQICPKLPDQPFDIPPSTDEEIVSLIYELGYIGNIETLPELVVDHMHQPWRTFSAVINRINLHTARDDSLLGTLKYISKTEEHQVYGALIPKEMLNEYILNSTAHKTYYAYANGAKEPKKERKFKKPASPKLKTIPVSPKEPTKKPGKAKKDVTSTKKTATKPKPTKKKASVKADRGKGLNVLSEVALSEAAQLKEISGTVHDVPKYESKSDKESWGDSGEEDDDVDDTEDDDNNDGMMMVMIMMMMMMIMMVMMMMIVIMDQSNKEHEEDEEEYVDEFSDKENDADNANEENEEELDDVEELYKDVNVNLRKADEEKDAHVTLTAVHDTQNTEADNQIASLMNTTVRQTSSFFTLPIIVIPKITSTFTTTILPPHPFFNHVPQQATPTPTLTASEVTTSFPTLLDFAFVFNFNDRVTNLEKDLSEMKQVDQYVQAISSILAIIDHYIDNKLGKGIQQSIKSHNAECREEDKRKYIDLIDTSVRTIIKEEVNSQLPQAVLEFATLVIERNITESLEAAILAKSSSQPKSTYEAAASLFEFELTKILMDKMEEHKSYLRTDYKRELYDALVKSYNTDKDLFDTYGESRESNSTSSSKGTSRSQHKSSGKSANTEEQSHTVDDSGVRQNQEFDTGNNDEQPDDEAVSKSNCNIARAKEPRTSFDELIDTPIDFSTFVMNWLNITNLTQELLPLLLIPNHQVRHVIPFNYFINNDLEYLKGGSLSRKYSTSVTKTKAATYEVQWIEDMVPNIWSPVKVVYIKNMPTGVHHTGVPNIKNFIVTSLKIMKWYDYGHLDEIEVRGEDHQLYTFKEGVKSYQKKLNLTKPDTFRPDLRKRTAYTTYSDPQGVIYEDQNNRNRLMHKNELHKFSDGMLNYVRTALHDISLGIRMDYLPKRKWSNLDKRRARVMIQDIDKQLFQRRLMRNLEKFVGGREYEEDLKLLKRAI